MKIKELIKLFNSFSYDDELFIFHDGEEVWQGYAYGRQLYAYLQDKEVDEMWLGAEGICISLK